MTLRLIIKGDVGTARAAAAVRDIPLADLHVINGETVGRADDGDLNAVESWFNEPPQVAPYPAGTLLHYSWDGLDGDFPHGSKAQ
jgi:hypothetical protein